MTANTSKQAGESPTGPADELVRTLQHTFELDPTTAISVVSLEGVIEWCNAQSALMFGGPAATPATFMGARLHERFPADWADERIALFHQIRRTGEPVRMRTIWRGFQQISLVMPIVGEDQQFDLAKRFLVITRRIPASPASPSAVGPGQGETHAAAAAGVHPAAGTQVVESQVADLGRLDVLSPRELEVLALLGQGLSLKETAAVLHRSPKTIENHRLSIARKLGESDRVRLASIAHQAGLTLRDAERRRVDGPTVP